MISLFGFMEIKTSQMIGITIAAVRSTIRT